MIGCCCRPARSARTPRFPPGPQCLQCGCESSTGSNASGRARVYSWIVVRHPVPAPIYAGDVPYVVALVELEEGVRMPTNIVDCAPEAVAAAWRSKCASAIAAMAFGCRSFVRCRHPGRVRRRPHRG
jgi:hypothetical protein